jgi:aminobenzoyl-glutamate utilization protein B
MELAARVLAATGWDLFTDAKLLAAARADFRQRLAGRTYRALLLPGQEPPLDYRNPPRRTAPPKAP